MDVPVPVVQHVASFADDNNLRRCFMKYATRMLALALISLPVLASAQMVSSTKVANVNLGSRQDTIQIATSVSDMLEIANLSSRDVVLAAPHEQPPHPEIGTSPKSQSRPVKHPDAPIQVAPGGGCPTGCKFATPTYWLLVLLV
jgi:hypothetical protein